MGIKAQIAAKEGGKKRAKENGDEIGHKTHQVNGKC